MLTFALNVSATAHTLFAVVGDALSLKEAAASLGAPSLVAAPEGSALNEDLSAAVAKDGDRTFRPDVQGLYTLRFGAKGSPGWRDVTLYAAPKAVETHPAFGGKGRKVFASMLAAEPLYKLDLSHVTDAHPWPLLTNAVTGEKHGPDWRTYGG